MSPAPIGESETAVALAVTANAVAADPAAMLLWQHLDVGAPVNVIFWVIVGAGAGVWNKRIKHKGNLAGAFFASFALTIGVIVGIPYVSGWHWDNAGLQAAMGLLLAFTSQNWGPRFLRAVDKGSVRDLRGLLADWISPSHRRDPDDPR